MNVVAGSWLVAGSWIDEFDTASAISFAPPHRFATENTEFTEPPNPSQCCFLLDCRCVDPFKTNLCVKRGGAGRRADGRIAFVVRSEQ